MKRFKLLVLAPRLPYPPVGGDRLRIYQLCRYLSQSFDLSLLTLCESAVEMNASLPADGIFTRIERVFHSNRSRVLGCARVLPSKTPLQVGYFKNLEFARRLDILAPQHDLLLAHLIRTAEYALPYAMPKILEMTDAISLSYKRAASKGVTKGVKTLMYREEAKRLFDYETEVVNKFDLSVLVSAVDRDFLFPQGQNKMLICPNGVDTEALRFEYSPDGATIVFIGRNTAFHNADAILYFTRAILPIIRLRIPKARFKVIGSFRSALKRLLAQYPGVDLIGPVDNLKDAAECASVGVCPVRVGAGLQNKLLDYMAMGIPAVTSSIGLEGLDVVPDIHLLLATSPQDWADRVCVLLTDTEVGRRLANAGRRFVESRYGWNSRLAPLRDAIVRRLSGNEPSEMNRRDHETLCAAGV